MVAEEPDARGYDPPSLTSLPFASCRSEVQQLKGGGLRRPERHCHRVGDRRVAV